MIKEKKEGVKGLVFSIQSYSVHDGPGARTTVFLNGCPLRCKWCCNPEGLFKKPVMLHSNVKCVQCGACMSICPENAATMYDGQMQYDRNCCDACFSMECIHVCLHEGNSVAGEYYTIDELMHRFNRERPFWGDHGGVTFSGGEPLLQKDFILPLLRECKNQYIHTCIETTGCVASDFFLEVLRYVDWVFVDVKHMNSLKHKEFTGVGNELILENIKLLSECADFQGIVVPRIPIIPDFNDDDENIQATAQYLKSLDLEVINILPFHKLGESKYRQLGQYYEFEFQSSPTEESMKHLKAIIENEGLLCYIGYDTPF